MKLVCMCVCVCVCVCVRVCACVCVCVYSFHVKASSVCKMSETYMKDTDQHLVSINLDASANFLHLRV